MSKAHNGATKIQAIQLTQETVCIHVENPYIGTTEVQGATWARAIAHLVEAVTTAVEEEAAAKLRRIAAQLDNAEAALAVARRETIDEHED